MNHPQVTAIVSVRSEVENLAELAERLFRALDSLGGAAELIVLVERSRDGTVELCRNLAQQFPLRLITHTVERGWATAVVRAIEESQGEILVVMDADLSHPPEAVPELVQALISDDTEFVIGSNPVAGAATDASRTWLRLLHSRLTAWLVRGLTTAGDPAAGFFALRRATARPAGDLNPCGDAIGLELLVRRNCRAIKEVAIHCKGRQQGGRTRRQQEQSLYLRHLFQLYRFRYAEVTRLAMFGAVGLSGMLVDLVCFSALLPMLGVAVSRATAIWIAMSWNFLLNRRFTFFGSTEANPFAEYVRFCAACLLGAGVSWTTAVTLMSTSAGFAERPVVSALTGTVLGAVSNYMMCRLWVFGRKYSAPTAPAASDDQLRPAA